MAELVLTTGPCTRCGSLFPEPVGPVYELPAMGPRGRIRPVYAQDWHCRICGCRTTTFGEGPR